MHSLLFIGEFRSQAPHVHEIVAHGFDLLLVLTRVAVIEKMRVSRMGRAETGCVFDRAPMLFRSRRHLGRVGEQAVSIGTEPAVETLQKIQVFQAGSIVNEIVRAPNLGNSVDREANSLVNNQEKIEQPERNDAGINDRRGEVRQESSLQQVRRQPVLGVPVLRKDAFLEPALSLSPSGTETLFLFPPERSEALSPRT